MHSPSRWRIRLRERARGPQPGNSWPAAKPVPVRRKLCAISFVLVSGKAAPTTVSNRFAIGDLTSAESLSSVRLFKSEIMPKLQNIHELKDAP